TSRPLRPVPSRSSVPGSGFTAASMGWTCPGGTPPIRPRPLPGTPPAAAPPDALALAPEAGDAPGGVLAAPPSPAPLPAPTPVPPPPPPDVGGAPDPVPPSL